jgi:hypothetical protein
VERGKIACHSNGEGKEFYLPVGKVCFPFELAKKQKTGLGASEKDNIIIS